MSGCALIVPAVPLALQPAERQSVINLKTVASTVDKSLQETVAISFVPPRAMPIDLIEYRVDGRLAAQDEYDLILQTAKLHTGEHTVSLYARGATTVVRGDTHLTVVESGKEPAPADDSSAGPAASAKQAAGSASGASQGSPAAGKAATPKWTGGKTEDKANVNIKIRLPED